MDRGMFAVKCMLDLKYKFNISWVRAKSHGRFCENYWCTNVQYVEWNYVDGGLH